MKFESLCVKYMLEATANSEEVGKRVYDELMSYINTRKQDMTAAELKTSRELIKDISNELNPDTIIDDLAELGQVVGFQKSYSRLVGRIASIVDELQTPQDMVSYLVGEPEAEPEPEPEMEPGDDDLEVDPEEDDELDVDPEEDEELEDEEDELDI